MSHQQHQQNNLESLVCQINDQLEVSAKHDEHRFRTLSAKIDRLAEKISAGAVAKPDSAVAELGARVAEDVAVIAALRGQLSTSAIPTQAQIDDMQAAETRLSAIVEKLRAMGTEAPVPTETPPVPPLVIPTVTPPVV
jgi:hypothetical protein